MEFYIILALVIVFAIAFVFFTVIFFLGASFFRKTFVRKKPRPRVDRSPQQIDQSTIFGRGQNWFYANRLDFENLHMRSYDRLSLTAYYLPAQQKICPRAIILAHGLGDEPSEMAAFAQMYLAKMDCHILIVHLRAHGMSRGGCIGYGLPDSQDILMWSDYLENRLDMQLEFIYHGCSIGAAAVLMAAGSRHVPNGLRGVIADSSFDSMENLLAYRLKSFPFFIRKLIQVVMNGILRRKTGYEIDQISPLLSAQHIDLPVLIIHGSADTKTPIQMGERIFEKIQAPKRFMSVRETEHKMSYDRATSRYSVEVNNLLDVAQIM